MQKNLASIMHAVQQCLPLLTSCAAEPYRRNDAIRDLQDLIDQMVSHQGNFSEAALQLERLKAAADELQWHTPDSMHLHRMNLQDMQWLLVQIRTKSNELNDTDMRVVLEGCVVMHRTLGVEVADRLQESSRQVLNMMVASEVMQQAHDAAPIARKHGTMNQKQDMMMEHTEQFIGRRDMSCDLHQEVRGVPTVSHSRSSTTSSCCNGCG